MKVGDLIAHDTDFWLVTRFDPKRTRTATLLKGDGATLEIPHDEPVEVIANPSHDWPFIAFPLKPKWGPVTGLTKPGRPGETLQAFAMYRDWMPSEPMRAGGSLFLSPNLQLHPGDYLLAHHADGHTTGLSIPPNFGTVRERQAKAAAVAAKPPVRTAFTRVLDDDQFDD